MAKGQFEDLRVLASKEVFIPLPLKSLAIPSPHQLCQAFGSFLELSQALTGSLELSKALSGIFNLLSAFQAFSCFQKYLQS